MRTPVLVHNRLTTPCHCCWRIGAHLRFTFWCCMFALV